MELNEVQKYLQEAKLKLGDIIKNEIKRRFVGETYSYLIKIPTVVFWLVAIVTTYAALTVELILAGIFLGDTSIVYGELLLGFSVAAIIGLITGKLYSSRVSKKVHDQIAEILKLKPPKSEEPKKG